MTQVVNDMKVLALDPGYDRLGIAVLERNENKDVLIFSECFETKRSDPLPDRLFSVGVRVRELLTEHAPDMLALETLFFNKNVKTAIGVAEVRGIILFLGKSERIPVYEFGPQEIKVAVTGYGKSDKTAVTNMVKRLVSNVPLGALDDEYDAIAVGVTALAHHRT